MEEALKIVRPAKFLENLYLPNYERNVFMVMPTAYALMGIEVENRRTLLGNKKIKKVFEDAGCMSVKNVIAILIDSLGFEQIPYSRILMRARESGNLILLSSVFPTITSTVLTSIYTGVPPECHGIVGFKIYIPEIGNVVDTLNMCTLDARERDALPSVGVNIKVFMWEQTVYENVSDDHLHVRLLESAIARTGISKLISEDVKHLLGYHNMIDCFSTARELLTRYQDRKILMEIYTGLLDELAHVYGPNSREYMLGLRYLEENLLRLAFELDDRICENTAVLIFSDHGQVELGNGEVVKLKREDFEEAKEFLLARPGKSGRIMHFYVKEEKVDEFRKWIEDKTGGKLVMEFDRIFKRVYPYKKNKDAIKARLGNLIGFFEMVIERDEEEILPPRIVSSHGSLLLNELVVPLAFFRLSDLRTII